MDAIELLGDVLDIIAAAEHQFAQTPSHHAYYDARFKAVEQAIALAQQTSPVCGDEGWQPIETAPKDGTRPLLGFADGVQFTMLFKLGWVGEGIEKGWHAWAYGLLCRKPDGSFFRVSPTHWRPLPEPPRLTSTTKPVCGDEVTERLEAICRLIERRAPDGDDSVLFDASVADQHAADVRNILTRLTSTTRTDR